jgi:LPXTG-site transpeptidase (sortase) family protein
MKRQSVFSPITFRAALVILFVCAALLPVQIAQAQSDLPPYPVQLTLQSISPNPAYVGQTVTFTVNASTSGHGDPTGSILVQTDEQTLCTLSISSGSGSCTLVTSTAKNYQVKAVYVGSVSYLPAVSAYRSLQVLEKVTPTLSATQQDPLAGFLGDPIQIGLQISGTTLNRTGTGLVFTRTGSTCAIPEVTSSLKFTSPANTCTLNFDANGTASCALNLNIPGTTELCAFFSGNDYLNPVVIPLQPQFIAAGNTLPQITSLTPNPVVLGQAVQVEFQVTAQTGLTAPASGAVIISGGGATCSASLPAHQCTLTPTTAGDILLSIAYSGSTEGMTVYDSSNGPSVGLRVNAAPQDISLLSALTKIPYNGKIGDQVAQFSVNDANSDDTHTLSLVSGSGADHNALFRIDGNRLLINASLEAYAAKTLSVRVRATDPAGLSVEKAFSFIVTAAPEDANQLPATGFAQGTVTRLPVQPSNKLYEPAAGIQLLIPALGVKADIVGVPMTGGEWDTTWLDKNVGWLEGSAFPTWQGNAILAGHNTRASGTDGPFAKLGDLKYGDQIQVKAFGQTYVYAVRSTQVVDPQDTSLLDHKEDAWLTLITCRLYNSTSQAYEQRILVQAQLIKILP